MASSPNVRRSPNSATGADAESAATTEAENQDSVVWKRPNMRGSKCSINEYVRLGIVKTIIAELRSVGDDTPDAQTLTLMYTGMMFHRRGACTIGIVCSVVGADIRPYSRSICCGYFREQPGDALKVAKVLCVCYLIFGVDGGKRIADRWLWMLVEDQTRWESFPWGLYSYQILVTCLSDVPTEVPAGLDPSYHFMVTYTLLWLQIWIGYFEVLSPTPEEEQEPYMQSISDASSVRVQYTHRMALCKRGGRGRGGLVMVMLLSVILPESILSGSGHLVPLFQPHYILLLDSSPIRGPRQTASSSTRGTQETAPIIDFDTLFTRLHTCIQSAVQEMRQYVDAVVEKSVKDVCRHIDELVRQSAPLDTPSWDFEGINEPMRNSPIEPRFDGAPIPPEQTMSVPDTGRSSLPTETRVDGGLSPTEQTEEVPSPRYPPVIPTEILVTPPEIAPRTRPSFSTADMSPIPLEYSSTTARADTYHSPRLQYRSYRPHSPFSTTVVRKRKDPMRRRIVGGWIAARVSMLVLHAELVPPGFDVTGRIHIDRCRTFGCIYGDPPI
ncbi:hypothetical protein OROHE_026851 [Orobanche hederae]